MYLTPDISPAYVKRLSLEEKKALCAELRHYIIENVSRTGGHLSSSLGTVELCVALHSVFSTPQDKLVFDVGHQAYAHKILTGRMKEFQWLRTEDGISGFPRPDESENDAFIGGHASIAISAALGIAKAMELKGENHHVVSIVGDGALTGGETYEGLNNGAKLKRGFIVILNDNEMSISKNSGAVASYLSQMRSTTKYYDTKTKVKDMLSKTAVGREFSKSVSGTKELVKFAIFPSNIFENLGYKYLGPIDGHNLNELIEALTVATRYDRPCIVHVKTKKGKGYYPAEQNSGAFHGVAKKQLPAGTETYSEVFGKYLARLGEKDSRICAITAAMKYGTGLQYFAKLYPQRFFDVGIAEEHGATFACGLASQEMLPVYAVYSTFLQRCFDQLIHDAAIEKYHLVLAVDRAGIVGEDGETHHGLFDVSMVSSVPGAVIYSPYTANELRASLKKAIYEEKGLVAVRYPKGAVQTDDNEEYSDYRLFEKGADTLAVTYGRITGEAEKAGCDVLQLVKIYPIDSGIINIVKRYKRVIFFEEGIRRGGIGERLGSMLMESGYNGSYRIVAVDNCFVGRGETEKLLEGFGMTECGMKRIIGEYEQQT